jgi:flagellar biosynthesis GTPase FlhF
MNNIFTTEELKTLSAQVDEQLRDLHQLAKTAKAVQAKGEPPEHDEDLLEKQRKAIEDNAKESSQSFLQKFGKDAMEFLCQENSLLNKQWKKWGDLNNEDVLEKFGVVLTVMGFTGVGLQILTVSITVYVIHIGVNAFCDKYCK